jgi:hypothetical protein
VSIPIGFKLDPNTILIHVLGEDEHDHVLKNYFQDGEGWVEVATTNASNDFHVWDVNINFALVYEVDFNVGETISSSFSLVEQVLTIHDLGYISIKQHGDHVSKMNMRIKQDHMPLMLSEPH